MPRSKTPSAGIVGVFGGIENRECKAPAHLQRPQRTKNDMSPAFAKDQRE